jgi:hypothetical protein
MANWTCGDLTLHKIKSKYPELAKISKKIRNDIKRQAIHGYIDGQVVMRIKDGHIYFCDRSNNG